MNYRRICALLIAALLLAAPLQVFATESIGSDASLTIEYNFGGARFDLYLVATIDEKGDLTMAKEFASYPVNLVTPGTDDARDLALTLQGYVLRDDIAPLRTQYTNDNGLLCFENLKKGLYLLLGEVQIDGQYALMPQPMLAGLPLKAGEQVFFHITVTPKFERNDAERIFPLEVYKVWDDGGSKNRPVSVTVDLLCDGYVYDTVVLNEKNDWRYQWQQLSGAHEWVIVERECEDHTVKVMREGNAIIVTNSKPAEPETPPSVPQTGMLWWPVPVLGVLGMLLFLIGWCRRRATES